MNELSRYLFKQLFLGMIFIASCFTGIIWLSQSLRLVELIVNRGVSAGTFVYLTLLMIPNFLPVILPIALFCIVVFVYARLIMDRELIVMRASGISQFSLAKPAVILALLVVGIGYFLNLYLIPESYRMFRQMQWDIRYNYSHILLKEGAFNELPNRKTVYVRERTSDGELKGILYHDNADPKKISTIMAARGALVESNTGARVVMFDGNRQAVDPNSNRLSVLYFDRHVIEIKAKNGRASDRHVEARERHLSELFNPENENISRDDRGKFIVEGHKRLVSPWQALTLTIVALACLISGSFSRRSQSKRILLSITLMVILLISTLALENISAKNLHLVPLIYLHSIISLFIGIWLIVRTPRYRPKPGFVGFEG